MGPVSKLFVTEVRLYLYSSDQRCLFVFFLFCTPSCVFIIYYLKFDIFFSFNLDAPKSHLFFYVYVICLFWLMFFFFFHSQMGTAMMEGRRTTLQWCLHPARGGAPAAPPKAAVWRLERPACLPSPPLWWSRRYTDSLWLTHLTDCCK